MARTLLLLRHAKSAWPDGVADHDRALTGRGRRDATEVGRWLAENSLIPELALVSSAQRTRETYEELAAALPGAPKPAVSDSAYAASAGELLDVVRGIAADVSVALLVAHNPGIGTLATLLDDESTDVPARFDMRLNYRTSACAVFTVDRAWAELDPATAQLVSFVVPRG